VPTTFSEGGSADRGQDKFLYLGLETFLEGHENKLVNSLNMWKGNGNTSKFLFSLKGLEIVYQERRGQENPIAMEHIKRILFHRSGPANKQHTYHLIN
jgi:hypothetical protein